MSRWVLWCSGLCNRLGSLTYISWCWSKFWLLCFRSGPWSYTWETANDGPWTGISATHVGDLGGAVHASRRLLQPRLNYLGTGPGRERFVPCSWKL